MTIFFFYSAETLSVKVDQSCRFEYLTVSQQHVFGDAVVVVTQHQLLRLLQHRHLQRFVFRRQKSGFELGRSERGLRLYDRPLEAAPILLLFLRPPSCVVVLLLLFLTGVF